MFVYNFHRLVMSNCFLRTLWLVKCSPIMYHAVGNQCFYLGSNLSKIQDKQFKFAFKGLTSTRRIRPSGRWQPSTMLSSASLKTSRTTKQPELMLVLKTTASYKMRPKRIRAVSTSTTSSSQQTDKGSF